MGLDASWAEYDIALDLFQKRQYREAIIAFENVLHFAQQISDSSTIIYAQLAIGESYFFLGNYNQALTYFNKAHSLAEQISNENLIALSCLKLARSSVQLTSFGEDSSETQIHYFLINALQLFESNNDDLGLMITHGTFGFLERLIGNEEAAFFHFRMASHKALLLKKPDLMTFYQKRSSDEASFPYISYFSSPKDTSTSTTARFPIELICPSCHQSVNPMVITCPFCEFGFYNPPRFV